MFKKGDLVLIVPSLAKNIYKETIGRIGVITEVLDSEEYHYRVKFNIDDGYGDKIEDIYYEHELQGAFYV